MPLQDLTRVQAMLNLSSVRVRFSPMLQPNPTDIGTSFQRPGQDGLSLRVSA